MQLSSGPASIVKQGTVTCFGGNPLCWVMEWEENTFEIAMEFSADGSRPESYVNTEHRDGGILFECVNFDGVSGKGSAVPVLLGELGDLLVFMHFRVFLYGDTKDRTVHFTIYQVNKDEVDWAKNTEL
jgi:hypothetical protein